MKVILPRVYLGTMTFGWSQTSSYVDESVAFQMLQTFVDHNIAHDTDLHYVDTARIYAGGKTETIVGSVLKKLGTPSKGIVAIGTKAHPSVKGGLSADGIKGQMAASLEAMGVDGVGEYYLHQPDTERSLLDSLRCAHELHEEGKFCCLGLSNFHVAEVRRTFELCDEHGLTRPTVYQGLYNPLNRAVEKELLPVLKANKCSFIAYNPLAAGLLAGKHKQDGDVLKGRFKNNQNYLPRFYTDSNFEALTLLRSTCEEAGVSLIEATFRWLLCHSALGEHDGVLLGASSMDQLKENLAACSAASQKDALPDTVLQAFDKAWELTEEGAVAYWRSYSADMPDRDSLPQGASYAAKKVTK